MTSPRMTSTTQFGHANCNIPEEEQIDIEYSIEERIEENISKLEKPPIQTPIHVQALIPETINRGMIEINLTNHENEQDENTDNVKNTTVESTPRGLDTATKENHMSVNGTPALEMSETNSKFFT